jgi:hypothetical protein
MLGERVRIVKATIVAVGLAVAIVSACSAAPAPPTQQPSTAGSATPSDDAAPWPSVAPGPLLSLLPDGVYVHTASREGLIAAGATGTDVENAGRWTLTVTGADGKLVLRHDDSNPDETWPLHFTLMGDRVRFQLEVEFFDMRWRLDRASLDLRLVASDSRVADHSNDAVAYRILSAILAGEWTKAE